MTGSDFNWKPKRTIEECDRIITAPGQIHELELTIIDGQVQKVYKNLPAVCGRLSIALHKFTYHSQQSLRVFWLATADAHKDRDYIVFENERYTYAQTHERVTKLASLLYVKYGVRKGDRGRSMPTPQSCIIHSAVI